MDAVLLTGFLGTGKTTLLKRILEAFENRRVGVIVNEFGEIGIDAALLKKDGVKMTELVNGSIFCACIKDNFVNGLIEMSGLDLEYLFIEASGLADPANMPSILEAIKHKTHDAIFYKGSICVVDAESFLELCDLLTAMEHQIEYSGAVIINKADLAEEFLITAVSEKISGLNPSARQYITSYCSVDTESLIDELSPVTKNAGETTNTPESRPKTFVLKATEIIPHDKLEELLQSLVGSAYRIKGFARTDKGDMEISCVGKNISFNAWSGKIDETRIVVISSVGIKMFSIISAALEKGLKGIIRL